MKKTRFIVALLLSAIMLVVIFIPIGPLPPLYSLLNPESGIMAPGHPSPGNYTFTMNVEYRGTSYPVLVDVNSTGFVRIASDCNWTTYYVQGYMEAKYRLEQMDIIKREAQGRLSQIIGPSELSSDIFFRDLMDCQIASEEFHNLSSNGYTYTVLSAFTDGINAYISNLSASNMPILFKILEFTPHRWNITNVLAIQQLFLWENSAGGTDPVYFNYALTKMPENVLKALYPAYPAGVQNPIVPYSCNPSVYNETGDIHNLSLYQPFYNVSSPSLIGNLSFGFSTAQVPHYLTGIIGNTSVNVNCIGFKDFGSNDWAANGIRTGNISALVANDPHLTTTVPSIWMGFQLISPGQDVVGVVFPGFPGIILGHNPYTGWGATNGQIQETYFYAEMVNSSNPYLYMNNGSWTHFLVINETIPVKGEKPYHITVERADNGVVLENSPAVIAMDWTGLIPSYEITFFLKIDRSRSVIQFRTNLTEYFKVAIQNWAVADSAGNIGIFPFGEYPVIEKGNPRGILPGTGEYNWIGFVPLSKEPYLYDPVRGFVFSDNQITVSRNYPFYIGWDYESGYRADEAYTLLNSSYHDNIQTMEKIQLCIHDFTTNIFLKPLIKALSTTNFSSTQEFRVLSEWNGDMLVNSTAATIYYFWIQNYVNDTFYPYMEKYGINQSEGLYSASFFLGPDDYYHGPLIEDLVNWTMNYPDTPWFDNPVNGASRNSTTLMIEAFNNTLSYLNKELGSYSGRWEWGNVHKRVLTSLFGISYLNTEEIPAAGDGNTINAAYGTISNFGPSWRMVVNMSEPVYGMGIYPGGLSENPLSYYYSNTFIPWNQGIYYALIPPGLKSQFYYLYSGGAVL